MSWTDALQLQVELEGGYVFSNNPDDPGGATYAGITLTELKQQAPDLAKSFPHLSQSDVGSYYYKWYWQTIKPLATHADMPEPADVVLFQISCNMGPAKAVLLLQSALLVEPDGDFGPVSARALANTKGPELAERLLAAQYAVYASHPHPEQQGLINRVTKVLSSDFYRGKGNVRL